MPKRRKTEEEDDVQDSTPRKSRRSGAKKDAPPTTAVPAAETPSKRKSILRNTPTKVNGTAPIDEPTPKSLRKVLFSTPAKAQDEEDGAEEETPTAVRNDRSARRKSARALQKQSVGHGSEDEEDEQEATIAKEILDEYDVPASGDEELEDGIPLPASTASTPSKRGRPKGKRRERTPSPPPTDLPPHELYFFQNRTGANKTSANTLPSHLLLNYEDYYDQIQAYTDLHKDDIRSLKNLHKRAFDQWMFELDEGFNLCLYGYGSKRELVMEFAEHVYSCHAGSKEKEKAKIVVVNGYTPNLTVRDIFVTLAEVIMPKNAKLPAQAPPLLDLLLSTLASDPPSTPIYLIIHSLDHANLRKPTTQALLARLASSTSTGARISLISTCDTPNFPLLHPTALQQQFRFLYHDTTSFEPYTCEIGDVVGDVNALLLGRNARRGVGGKDGVAFVLKSLPENARALFRILVAEQLALGLDGDAVFGAGADGFDDDGEDDDILGMEDENAAAEEQNTPSRRGRGKGKKAKSKAKAPTKAASSAPPAAAVGVEYRTLYHKAVEQFVCSSELNFRTLLKEFHDHAMIEAKKDAMGTETLIVPFRKEELEEILMLDE